MKMKKIESKFRPKISTMLRFPTEKEMDLYFSLVDDFDELYVFPEHPELYKKYINWCRKKKLNNIDFIYNDKKITK